MRKIKRRDGFVFILSPGETCPSEEICLLESEYEWAKKLSASFSNDPEQMRGFWEILFEKKKTIPGYLLFHDFSLKEEKTEPVKADPNKPLTAKELAIKYGTPILEKLRGRNPAKTE